MFDLVADISAYPEFLPWCAAARVRKEVQKGDIKQIEADLVISFKVFREKFGSRVLLESSKFIFKSSTKMKKLFLLSLLISLISPIKPLLDFQRGEN